jgi:pimeloyl-ACP methyl ester carboxylesterase
MASEKEDILYHELRPATVGATSDPHPLLFLHGALGSMSEFDNIIPRFSDRDCILLDLPAHGKSQALNDRSTAGSFATAVLHHLEIRGIHAVDVIGYSLGGYVALEMALLSHTRVRSIISHAMKFYWTDEAINGALRSLNWEEVRNNEKRRTRFEAIHIASGAEIAFRANTELISNFKDAQLTTRDLEQLHIPLLLSVGDSDELVPLIEIQKLYTDLGYDRASLAVHPNTPHPLSKLHPESFERAARQFWKATLS